MSSPSSTDLHDLAQEDQAPAEQILANALQLYAAIPGPARAATLRALRATDPAAQPALAREVVRTIVAFQLQERRAAAIRNANGGTLPTAERFDAAEDEALGAEAVARIKASRERRADRGR